MTRCQHMDGESTLVQVFLITAAGQMLQCLSPAPCLLCVPSSHSTHSKTRSSPMSTPTYLDQSGVRSCRVTTSSSAGASSASMQVGGRGRPLLVVRRRRRLERRNGDNVDGSNRRGAWESYKDKGR